MSEIVSKVKNLLALILKKDFKGIKIRIQEFFLSRKKFKKTFSKINHIYILADENTEKSAQIIRDILSAIGMNTQIVFSENEWNKSQDNLYFLLSSELPQSIPPNSLLLTNGLGNPKINQKISGKLRIFLAQNKNEIKLLLKAGIHFRQIFYFPLGKNEEINFKFYLLRILLAYDIITFEDFYHNCDSFFQIMKKTCISLPEQPERTEFFLNNKKDDFAIFPGLRHNHGWIGCALSFKFLARKAIDEKLFPITICEDDTIFPSDYLKIEDTILSYLSTCTWDIFVGLMTDFPEYASVSQSTEYKKVRFIHLNTIVSMVYNIYSQKILELISKWDYKEKKTAAQIDQYIKNHKNIHAITTSPFLFGHNSFLDSSAQPDTDFAGIYDKMIAETEAKIKKADQWKEH